MSRHTNNGDEFGTYEPEEFTLRFPDKPVLDAHWSDVWPLSFKQSINELLNTTTGPTLAADLSLGTEVLRMASICGQSLKEGGKLIEGIILTQE